MARRPPDPTPRPPDVADDLATLETLEPLDLADVEDHGVYEGRVVTGSLDGRDVTDLEFLGCRFEAAELTGSSLTGLRVVDAVLADVEASGTILDDARFTRCAVRSSRLLGVQLPAGTLEDVRFDGCRLDDANLRMLRGRRVLFERCRLAGADLRDAEVADCTLWDCDLSGVDVQNARLPGCRLHGSVVDDLLGAGSMRDATIDSTQVVPLALRVFAALGIRVDDERGPGT